MTIISGVLIDGMGRPLPNTNMRMVATSSVSTLVNSTATVRTGSDGSYSFPVEVGSYAFYIEFGGLGYQFVGNLNVYADTPNASLDQILVIPPEAQPMVLAKMLSILVDAQTAASSAASSVVNILTPLGKMYPTLTAAQNDIANIPEGGYIFVRSSSNEAIADEYAKTSGVLSVTGKKLPAAAYVKALWAYLNNMLGGTSIPLSSLTGSNSLSMTDGAQTSSVNWKNSGYIPTLKGQGLDLTAASNSATSANVVFFDANYAFVEARQVSSNGLASDSYVVPVDGYMILSTRTATSSTFSALLVDKAASKKELANQLASLTALIATNSTDTKQYADELVGYTDIPLSSLTGASYINPSDGSLVLSSQWKSSAKMSISPGQRVSLTAVCLSTDQANIAFYASSGAFISAGRVSSDNVLTNKLFTAPADAATYAVCTRTGTTTSFKCHKIAMALTSAGLDTSGQASSFDTSRRLSLASEVSKAVNGGVDLTINTGYINAAGVLTTTSVQRRYFVADLVAGESVYYDAYAMQSQIVLGDIPLALFIPTATGVPVEVQGNPLNLSGAWRKKGIYTATEAGKLYINCIAVNRVTQLPETSTASKGVIGSTLLYRERLLTKSSINSEVISMAMSKRDTQAIIANGTIRDVTSSLEYENDKILYKNGSKEDSTTAGVWSIALLPVREGDIVTMWAWFNTNSAASITYISQLGMNKEYKQSLLDDFGLTGYYTRSVTAVSDGYIAMRVRRLNGTTVLSHTVHRQSDKYFSYGDTPGEGAMLAPQMDLLPVELDASWLYNSPSYQQDGIVVRDGYIYMVCIAKGRKPHILKKSVNGGQWSIFDLSTIAGNPFVSPNAQDGHNSFSVAVTKDGYILITGNHHAQPCRCVVSNNPHDITSWTQIFYTEDPVADTVTYPRFLRHPDGTTQVLWRQGTSGNGVYYMNTFDDATRQFGSKKLVIDAPDGGNPYEQTIVVDNSGTMHICWGYRTTASSADANYGLYYAKSPDKGATWSNASGDTAYALPLNSGNSEKPVNIPSASGYVNQNGACADLDGRFHTVYWLLDSNGFTQIMHLWFNGATWSVEAVSRFTYTENTKGSLLNGTSSRPQICCTRYGSIYVVYRTTEDGRGGAIRAIDVTTPGSPKDRVMVPFNSYKTELSLNVWDILQTGIIRMMLYRGINRPSSALPGQYLSEPAWLMQASMP